MKDPLDQFNDEPDKRDRPEPACDVWIYSDLTLCKTCHLRWDTNDSDPPACPRGR